MQVIERVRRFVDEHRLIAAGARIAAAVSGGSDSMALLHVLRALDGAGELRLAGVAHFNHQLRSAAVRDERFVAGAASALGLRCVTGREDVGARARREGRSLEHAGRAARYEFFARARLELGADLVALGHTRDDQAETLLLRLVRGAGPRGLSGMHPRTGWIVRPVLDCRRHDLRSWLLTARPLGTLRVVAGGDRPGLDVLPEFLDDETNSDVSIPRNRVRGELVPLLAERFNPSIVDTLAGEAALLRDLWLWAEEASRPFFTVPGSLDVVSLRAAPLALRRLVVWRAMAAASEGRSISFEHVAAAIRLIDAGEDGEGRRIDVPGHTVQRIGGRLVLTNRRRSPVSRKADANLFRLPLSIPGEVQIPGTRSVVSAEDAPASCAEAGNGAVAVVRRDRVQGSLVVRNRRPGDRFRPVGLGGSKKLQDLFVDRKLPLLERDCVPLVVDGTDQIVWVAGYGIDEAFRVTDPSQAVLVLRLTRA